MQIRKLQTSKIITPHQKKWFHNPLNWLVFFVVVISFFPLYRFIRKQLQRNKEQMTDFEREQQLKDNQNPIKQLYKANSITPNKAVQAAAQSLANDFGVFISKPFEWTSPTTWLGGVFDYRKWTENDKNISDTLIYQRNNYDLLIKLYAKVYTDNRSLPNDILNYLDKAELKRVRNYIKV